MENNLYFELAVFIVAVLGGSIGAVVGLGGALIITPLLSTVLHIPIHYAIGASLVAIICTSMATSLVSLKFHGLTKEKLGIFLALAAVTGGTLGAKVAIMLRSKVLFLIFGGVLIVVLLLNLFKKQSYRKAKFSQLAKKLQLNDSIILNGKSQYYDVENPVLGFISMSGAGFIAGLLGIGAGIFKVITMDKIMKVPLKVSTSTSNFIMGITAFVITSTYYNAGFIDSLITLPVALGTLFGATIGSKVMPRIPTRIIRLAFLSVVLAGAAQMIIKGLA